MSGLFGKKNTGAQPADTQKQEKTPHEGSGGEQQKQGQAEKTGQANTGGKPEHDWLIPEEGRDQLRKVFAGLPGDVHIQVYTGADPKNLFDDYARRFVADLAALAPRIRAEYLSLDSDEARAGKVTLSPTLLLNPQDYRIRFTGAPLGEEARAFIEAIFLVSARTSGLSEAARSVLAELHEARAPRVFSSPGCPYCPAQCANAVKCAIERPDLISAECINADEFPELSAHYGVGSVPHTQFDETYKGIGLMPEERFAVELVTLKDAENWLRAGTGQKGGQAAQGGPAGFDDSGIEVVETDLVVLGAGPAGLSAAIYAERSGLSTVVLDKAVVGGQVTVTPVVENYPGFADIAGLKLVEVLSSHARQYATIRENEPVEDIKVGRQIEVHTPRNVFVTRALIFATGAQWRKIDVPGEDRFYGKGVSYCASCDGYAYRNRKVAVIGGGNTALTDALHLHNLGVQVTMIHRRDSFRAEKALQDSLTREGIPVIWNAVLEEVMGDTEVRGVRLRDTKTGEKRDVPFDGVFVAIGHVPNSEQAADLGIDLEPDGSIKVDRHMRTNIPRVYAAGDVIGGVRQIVTAVGSGATAALSAFEDLQQPRWKKDRKA